MAERKKKAEVQAETPAPAKRGRKPKTETVVVIEPEKVDNSIEEKADATPVIYTVACKSRPVLNVRSGAGKNYPIIKQLANGTPVEVYEQADGWCKVGPDEWVMAEFLK